MKKQILIQLIIIITLGIYSCKKDNDETPAPVPVPPVTYPNYGQLKVGNYWIYERFTTDSLGNGTFLNTFDSCYVEKDTVINNKTYFKYVAPDLFHDNKISFIKDSLSYLVTNTGFIIFSSDDFTTVFHSHYYILQPTTDTLCLITQKMADANLAVNMPLGTYTTSSFQTKYTMLPPYTSAGTYRYQNTRYTEGVGKVSETLDFFLSSPVYTERRLYGYHLN